MPDIELVKPHSLTIAKAKAMVQKAADAIAAEYDLTSEWHGNTLHFHRSGVDGQMHVTDSEIRLHVTLGFLLKAFKRTLVDHIERNFDKLMAEQNHEFGQRRPTRKTEVRRDEWRARKKRRDPTIALHTQIKTAEPGPHRAGCGASRSR
jgi:putative polyhydroxyalkanoate system protein